MTSYTPPSNKDSTAPHTNLRDAADTAMRSGNLDLNSGWVLPAVTLEALYKMASDPDSAPDALKLLHELQTHQVELELQYRQLLSNEQFIKEQLSKFKSLLDVSSIGYLMADADGQISEINDAAIGLLDIADHDVIGTPVSQFFQPHAQTRLRNLFKQLADQDDSADVVCIEPPQGDNSADKQLKITASITLAGNAVMMTIREYLPSQTN